MAPVFYSDIETAVNTICERNTYSTKCLDAVNFAIDIFTHYINAEEFIRAALAGKHSSPLPSVKEHLVSMASSVGNRASLMHAKDALTRLVEHHPEAMKAGIEALDAIPNNSESIQRINKKIGGVPNPRDHIRGWCTFNLLATHSVDEDQIRNSCYGTSVRGIISEITSLTLVWE